MLKKKELKRKIDVINSVLLRQDKRVSRLVESVTDSIARVIERLNALEKYLNIEFKVEQTITKDYQKKVNKKNK